MLSCITLEDWGWNNTQNVLSSFTPRKKEKGFPEEVTSVSEGNHCYHLPLPPNLSRLHSVTEPPSKFYTSRSESLQTGTHQVRTLVLPRPSSDLWLPDLVTRGRLLVTRCRPEKPAPWILMGSYWAYCRDGFSDAHSPPPGEMAGKLGWLGLGCLLV